MQQKGRVSIIDSTLGSLIAVTGMDLAGFFTGLSRIREESNKIGTVQVRAKLDTTAMAAEIARSSVSWKDLQSVSDQSTQRITRNLGGMGNEAVNLRNQLRQAGSEFRTMDADAGATKAKVAGIVSEARSLKAGFAAGTAEARVLTSVIEQGRAALGAARPSTSPVIAQLRQEQAVARQSVQDVNNYRVAWQRKANDDATSAALIQKLELGILSQKKAIDAEIASLRNLGVLEEQQQARVTALIAQRNTYNTALKSSSSVLLQISGEIQKGSLAAGVAAGTQAAATRGLTAEVDRLIATEKLGIITKKELAVALLTETTAHRTALTAIQAEALGLRDLGVLDIQQTQRLAALVVEQDRYTAALLRSVTAQQQSAGMTAKTGFAKGAGVGGGSAMSGAGMALSMVSPEAGALGMAASMGPVVGSMMALGMAVGGVLKLTKDGQTEAKKLQQAFLVMSANGVTNLDEINTALNDITKNGSDAEKMFSKSELAGALAALARGGVKGADALTTLGVSAKLAAAEHIPLSEATERLYGNLQHLDMAADEASGFGDKLARASHLSMASMDNLSKGLNIVGATAHMMGYSVEETLSIMVRLAQKGMDPASVGATGLRNALQKAINPSKEGAAIYEQLGVALRDASSHMRSGRDIMEQLRETFSSTRPVYNQLTGDIITKTDLAALSFKLFGTKSATAFISATGDLRGLTDEVKNSSGFLNTYSGEVVSGLTGSQQRLDAATKNLSSTFAKTFTPALADIVEGATSVVTWIRPPAKVSLGVVG